MDLKEKIKLLPLTSGVYLMKNAAGKIIYVGKAVSIRKRVQSYFRSGAKNRQLTKTDLLVDEVDSIDWLETASEAEALILEASKIKEFRPKYNISLLDDKTYPYITLSKEDYPRVAVDRPHTKDNGVKYYGPYVNAGLIRQALGVIRRIFHFRTCHPFPDKECLDYHIGLCDAPCIGNISKKEYKENIRNVLLILEGKKDVLFRRLNSQMQQYSKTHEFEKAAKVRDQLKAVGALYSGTKDVNYYKEAEQLKRALMLDTLPVRIETFDISNTMGNQAVGSMVSFFNGKADKRNYRRFKIKSVEGIDDFSMIAEIVRRRYLRLKNERLLFPDLIVIDGGKGQLSAACAELERLEIQIPTISLAKREEEVFLPKKKNPVILSRDSLGLKLLMRMRDEAHRFAISYHRKLRGENVFSH